MKKIIPAFLFISLFINCSSGDDSTSDNNNDNNNNNNTQPIAVDDFFDTLEDTDYDIENLLSNDTIEDYAYIESFDETTIENGIIVDNRDDTYTYTPADDFVGEDSFTYTLCDNDSPADCSTATVTIIVADQGDPVAEDDAHNVTKNTTKTITNLLDNDSVIDEAILSSIDTSGTLGEVVFNTDGSILYTPPTNYVGSDSFSYNLCDDDTPDNTCSSAVVSINVLDTVLFNIPADLLDYYTGVQFSEDSGIMYDELSTHTTDNHTTILTYTQRHQYLYDADADLTTSDNVVLMYSGETRYWQEYTSGSNSYTPQTFNTEHVYPQSLLNSSIALTDLYHLRVCDASINTTRSNKAFAEGSGAYSVTSSNKWFPGDEWRGDVARMILYLNIRYGESFAPVGNLDLFLTWNLEDPVSEFENQRNTVIYSAQGNRNPFIDNPYLATIIWGGEAAENKWD